jgi:hypothetical protein
MQIRTNLWRAWLSKILNRFNYFRENTPPPSALLKSALNYLAPIRRHPKNYSIVLGLSLFSLVTLPIFFPATGSIATSPEEGLIILTSSQSPSSQRKCWSRYVAAETESPPRMIIETAFRVPCIEQITPYFIATLQRALAARGHYNGPITGLSDTATVRAVQDFQKLNGFNSPILTLETAQRLGLLPSTQHFGND